MIWEFIVTNVCMVILPVANLCLSHLILELLVAMLYSHDTSDIAGK